MYTVSTYTRAKGQMKQEDIMYMYTTVTQLHVTCTHMKLFIIKRQNSSITVC